MQYIKPRVREQPEKKDSQTLRNYMEARGWWIKKIHGSTYQSGLPDLLCIHSVHGTKWIENKVKKGKLRPSQITTFGEMRAHGCEVYVVENYRQYNRIFEKRGNWLEYARI